jgi:hypothetical protein
MASIKTGDFVAIADIKIRAMPEHERVFALSDVKYLSDAYNAITEAECWEHMKNFNDESFMFSQAPFLNKIQSHMKMLDNHSGASFGCIMRQMEYIAKKGWEQYVKMALKLD